MFDVKEVVLKLLARRMDCGNIALVYLRPSTDARPHDMPINVK